MLDVLRNVCPTHLLDQDVARAWAERDPEIRMVAGPELRTRHAAAPPTTAAARAVPAQAALPRLRLPVVD